MLFPDNKKKLPVSRPLPGRNSLRFFIFRRCGRPSRVHVDKQRVKYGRMPETLRIDRNGEKQYNYSIMAARRGRGLSGGVR